LFVLLYFFLWPLCCLFFVDIRILITSLVSSNSSFILLNNLFHFRIRLFISGNSWELLFFALSIVGFVFSSAFRTFSLTIYPDLISNKLNFGITFTQVYICYVLSEALALLSHRFIYAMCCLRLW
jgi:hypothetical protein